MRRSRAFLEKLTKSEILPVVPPPPNTNLDDYRELIARRFANPKIGDTIQRLCFDGSNRQPKFILPDGRRSPEIGRVHQGPRAGLGSVVPLLLRRNRERQADRAERSELGPSAGGGEAGAQRPAGLPRDARHFRRSRATIQAMSARFPMRSPRFGRTAFARRWPTICRARLERKRRRRR